jgi:hypothetical protein
LTSSDYSQAEQQFVQLLETGNLDRALSLQTVSTKIFEAVTTAAIKTAYGHNADDDAAHHFLQRILYRINRLRLFWYDDLHHYTNEQSLYLKVIQSEIENAWQQWELTQLNSPIYPSVDVEQALVERTTRDIDPPLSAESQFIRDRVTIAGYRHLVAIASLDGLVEASQLSRTLGGVANEVHSVLTRLLVEEYGGGRLSRKHSSYFVTMLEELGMNTEPEAYFDSVPWEVLAMINRSFLLSEYKQYFLQYIGGLLYTEVTVPAAFLDYQVAGERLGLTDAAMSYWKLHIKVDRLHGRWMLDDVALPLIQRYSKDAWQILLGYDQQRQFSDRIGRAVVKAAKVAEQRT